MKGKHMGRLQKMSNHWDRKLNKNKKRPANRQQNKWENKWAETEVNVCERTVRNWLREIGTTFRSQTKTSIKIKQKETRLQWVKEKESCEWRDESEIQWWITHLHWPRRRYWNLSGAVLTKHITMTTWRKQSNFPTRLWYGAAYQVNYQGRWQSFSQQSTHRNFRHFSHSINRK